MFFGKTRTARLADNPFHTGRNPDQDHYAQIEWKEAPGLICPVPAPSHIEYYPEAISDGQDINFAEAWASVGLCELHHISCWK